MTIHRILIADPDEPLSNHYADRLMRGRLRGEDGQRRSGVSRRAEGF